MLSHSTSMYGTIEQKCGSFITYQNAYTNTRLYFVLPNGFSNSRCYYNAYYAFPVESVFIQVYDSGVSIQSPNNGTTIAAGSLIPFMLEYATQVDPNPVFNVTFDCNTSGMIPDSVNIPGRVPTEFSVPSNFYGTDCIFTVSDPNNVYPSLNSVNLTVTQAIRFINPPTQLFVGQSIQIQMDTTGTILPEDSFTVLSLSCNNHILQSWDSTPLNEEVTLSINYGLTPSRNCFLSTSPDNPAFPRVNLSIMLTGSPSGGTLLPITQEQSRDFAKSIIFR